jgi:hypothetical protein
MVGQNLKKKLCVLRIGEHLSTLVPQAEGKSDVEIQSPIPKTTTKYTVQTINGFLFV